MLPTAKQGTRLSAQPKKYADYWILYEKEKKFWYIFKYLKIFK